MSKKLIIFVPNPLKVYVPAKQEELLNLAINKAIDADRYSILVSLPCDELDCTTDQQYIEYAISVFHKPENFFIDVTMDSGIIITIGKKGYILLSNTVVPKIPDKVKYITIPAWPTIIAVPIKVPAGMFDVCEYSNVPGVIT